MEEKFGDFVVYFKSCHIDSNILPINKATVGLCTQEADEGKYFINLYVESLLKKITAYLNDSFH